MQKAIQLTKIVIIPGLVTYLCIKVFLLSGQTDSIQNNYEHFLPILEDSLLSQKLSKKQLKQARSDLKSGKYENLKINFFKWGQNELCKVDEDNCIYFALMSNYYKILKADEGKSIMYDRYLITEKCRPNFGYQASAKAQPMTIKDLQVLEQIRQSVRKNEFFEFQICFYTNDFCEHINSRSGTYIEKLASSPDALSWLKNKFNLKIPIISETVPGSESPVEKGKEPRPPHPPIERKDEPEERKKFIPSFNSIPANSIAANSIESNFLLALHNRFRKKQDYNINFSQQKNDLNIELYLFDKEPKIISNKYENLVATVFDALELYVKITEANTNKIEYSWEGSAKIRYKNQDFNELVVMTNKRIKGQAFLEQLKNETNKNLSKLSRIGTIKDPSTLIVIELPELFEDNSVEIHLKIKAKEFFAHEIQE